MKLRHVVRLILAAVLLFLWLADPRPPILDYRETGSCDEFAIRHIRDCYRTTAN